MAIGATLDLAVFESLMREALYLAQESAAADEVPVGAVVAQGKGLSQLVKTQRMAEISAGAGALQVLGRGRDRKTELSDPTAHAEILALREAALAAGDWRLEDCVLVVTLEPCPMCAGAALLSRIPLVIYGARNPKFGAIETQIGLLMHGGWNHSVLASGGCLESECSAVLKNYFQGKRQHGD
jgi:tRNA(adenine34) deaminase